MYKLISFVTLSLILLGCGFHNHTDMKKSEKSTQAKAKDAVETKKHEEYYTCSMHPHVREHKAGKCPICQMNLTKVVVEKDIDPSEPSNEAPMVKEESATETIARVKLRKAQLSHFYPEVFSATTMKMSKKLRVLGRVKSAEEKESNISARFPARVEKVFVESVGSHIRKGDPVVQVYSPELLTAGEELILSAKQSGGKPEETFKDQSNEFNQLYKKAREKLLLWGIRSSQVNRWVKNGKVPRNVTLYASSSGVVRKRIAVPGKYFKEGQNYFELSDLSQVWVEMDVYEHNSNLVKPGQSASLSFVALPGKSKNGEIDFISPTIDEKTRTLKIRATIANDEGTLKPGMVAQGVINVVLDGTPIVVPTSAVIDTGTRKIVWMENGPRKYIAKVVKTGFLSDGYIEIKHGVEAGDRVVIEGNFMLDAQAQFFGGYEDFSPSQAEAPKGHSH